MTALEMIIAVKLGLQRQASNKYSSIDDEEIEIALNEAQSGFIKSRFQKEGNSKLNNANGFQVSQKRLDDIRSVMVANYRMPAIKPSINGYDSYMWAPNMHYATLPQNYMFLVNDRTSVQYVKGNICFTLDVIEDTPIKEFVCALPYTAVEAELCSNSPVFRIEINSEIVFNISDWPQIKFKKTDQKYEIINIVLEFLNRFNSLTELVNYNTPGTTELENVNHRNYFNVYWERYKDQYYPSCFVFVSNSDDVTTNSDDDDTVFNNNDYGMLVELFTNNVSAQSSRRFRQKSYLREKVNEATYNPQDIVIEDVPNRLHESESIYKALSYPFNKTIKKSPITSISSQFLYVYNDGTFVPKEIVIDYIRTPRPISAKLEWNCELSPHTHSEIVGMAVMFILDLTSDAQRLQTKMALNESFK